MLFRQIIFSALLIGFLSGLVLTAAQYVGVWPIIFAAEEYEVSVPESAPIENSHEHAGAEAHHHDTEAWGPEDGTERTLYSLLSNVLAGIGFSAMLLAVMSQLQLKGITNLSIAKGLAFGLAGFIAFFAAPGIGLPPEIPGIDAAALEHRQLWWTFTVIASIIGLGVLAFAKSYYKLVGIILLALPFLVGAPHISGPEFSHPDENAVAILTALHHQFILASGVTNLIFWLVLGALCAWILNRQILNDDYAPS